VHQGGRTADARTWRRRHRQHHLDLGGTRLDAGIRVNGVAPGPVETAMAKAVHTPEIRADYHDAIPLNRYGLEEELAEAVFFLCSERSSYITGQILAVDGGFDAAGIGLPTLRGQRRNG
jgi:NAD(P)-dependent dehydrogenase (short-subunit alcohol dehydrogenase family)